VRILLATDYYPPGLGGAQIQSHLIARELRARGHEVAVATVWQHGLPAFELDEGIPVHRLRQLRTLPVIARAWRHHQPPFPDPITVIPLRRLIARFRPDVVHSYGWFSYSCAFALLGRDIPLLLTARDYAYSCATRTLLYKGRPCSGPALLKCMSCAGREYGAIKGWIAALGVRGNARLLRRKVRAIHSISTYVQAIVRRDFLDDRKRTGAGATGHVIHDVIGPVPAEHVPGVSEESYRARLDELPAEPFLLFVGGLRRVKGVEQLLSAYERLSDPPPLVLIGTLERDSPPQFPAHVHVLTDFPHEAVMAAWEHCLFAVLPSVLPEPFGTVVSEAMSCGKAVIGTRPGGHRDMIVDGKTGFLVPAGDVAALADAMQRLISDPELRDRFGAAGRVRAQLFTPNVATPRLERLYKQLVTRQRAAES
jgi:glycosyltransferase involved in cell wall biosynthesis